MLDDDDVMKALFLFECVATLSQKKVLLLLRFDDENDVSLLKVETLNLSFYIFRVL